MEKLCNYRYFVTYIKWREKLEIFISRYQCKNFVDSKNCVTTVILLRTLTREKN